jgi:hypothetical protein
VTVTLKFDGELAPVAFEVQKRSLFGFSFLVTDEKDIKKTDRSIMRHRCFSLTPQVGYTKLIGRILKITILEDGSVIYAFMVDEVRVLKKPRKVD